MFDYLENLRTRPGHVRRRIAAGTAAGVTALVAFGWVTVAVSSGTFAVAIQPASTLAASGSGFGSALAQTKSGFSSLLGAASAGLSNTGSASNGGIVIETTQASTTVNQSQPTTLSF